MRTPHRSLTFAGSCRLTSMSFIREMARNGGVFFVHGLNASSVVCRILPFVCCVCWQPFPREEVTQRGRGKTSRSQRECRKGSGCLPARGVPFPEPALHHFSAGGAPTLWEPRPRLLCPLPAPPSSCTVESVIAAAASASCHTASLPSLPVLAWTCGLGDLEQGFHHSRPAASKTSCSRRNANFPIYERHQFGTPRHDFQTSQGSQI